MTTPRSPRASTGLSPADIEVSWRLVRGERDCTVTNPQTGAVVARAVPIDDDTLCSLVAVGEKRGYRAEIRGPIEIPLEKGDLGTISPPDYGLYDELALGGRADMMTPPREAGGAHLEVSYTAQGTNSGGENVCRVDADGTVHALPAAERGNTCIISTRVTAIGYNDPTPGAVPDVILALKEGLLFYTHPEPVWDGILTVGVSAPLSQTATLPPNDDSTPPVSVTWVIG